MEVRSPNPDFTGDGPHGVAFVNGVGKCYTAPAIDWFRRKGYELIPEPDFDTESVLKAAEGTSGVDTRDVIAGRPSEDASESVALTEEERRLRYGIGVGTLLPQGHSITGAPAIDAGLPQLSHEQRAKLREYLDETEAVAAQEAVDAVTAPAPTDDSVKSTTSTTAKKTASKSSRARKSSARKSTAKKTASKS